MAQTLISTEFRVHTLSCYPHLWGGLQFFLVKYVSISSKIHVNLVVLQ